MQAHPLYLYALDPTHVGAGGYRLGRVDLTILRDASTQLPKIPGSSISGATRSAALHMLADDREREQAAAYAAWVLDKKKPKPAHRAEADPVASVFGYSAGEEGGSSRIGMVSFRDAEILALPVPTMLGPRWVTTATLLERVGCKAPPRPASEDQIFLQGDKGRQKLNLGWLLLDAECRTLPFPKPGATAPESLKQAMEQIQRSLVVVHDNLFPALVNSNLETRTSVSIDFETGAAAETALFTYEAAPRGTLYLGAVDFDDLRFRTDIARARTLVEGALHTAGALGLGGMTTRGFGRMAVHLEAAK